LCISSKQTAGPAGPAVSLKYCGEEQVRVNPDGQLEVSRREGLLLLFLLRIALLAGLAVFGGFNTALVLAFLTGGFGLFAAGFCASDGQTAEEGDCSSTSGECFHLYFLCLLLCVTEPNRNRLLALFFRIALFAGLAVFRGFDTALVRAFFSGGLGFFATGFSASDAHAGENRHGAGDCGKCLN
jgi:small neutral amino acid transporter SnatA (MarC family)